MTGAEPCVRTILPNNNNKRRSQRDRQERVDLPAVEDHDLFGEPRLAAVEHDLVLITAGGKKQRLAAVHDAGDHEIRLRPELAAALYLDQRWAEDMAVALRLVDVGLAQR